MGYRERAYLSLDGILDGDIPATAATGYGFHLHGGRPLADPNIVKELGTRAVPLVSTTILLVTMMANPTNGSTEETPYSSFTRHAGVGLE